MLLQSTRHILQVGICALRASPEAIANKKAKQQEMQKRGFHGETSGTVLRNVTALGPCFGGVAGRSSAGRRMRENRTVLLEVNIWGLVTCPAQTVGRVLSPFAKARRVLTRPRSWT